MSNVNVLLRSCAHEQGVSLEIIQKDYAISYLLVSMAQTPGLGEKIVLKGGTVLRKCYYPGYRFSEDLDYSTIPMGSLARSDELVRSAVARMAVLLQDQGPFEVQVEPLVLPLPHPGKQIAYLVRIRFPDQRQALCRLKVEITVDEPVLMPVTEHPILHGFPEVLDTRISGYSLEEVVAEKLRALLQSRERLASRGWGASRVCRDYYDLWWILGREKLIGVPDLFFRKCGVRNVRFDAPETLISPSLMEVARREWNQQLSPFLTQPIQVDAVLSTVRELILALF